MSGRHQDYSRYLKIMTGRPKFTKKVSLHSVSAMNKTVSEYRYRICK